MDAAVVARMLQGVPTPRPVRMRPEAFWRVWIMRIGAVLLAGLGLLVTFSGVRARSSMPRGLRVALWWGFVCLFGWVTWADRRFHRGLIRDGEVAVGTVTGKDEERGSKGGRVYRISYRFSAADGRAWSGSIAVQPELFAQLSEGEAVVVLYRKLDPAASGLYSALDYLLAGRR